MNLTRVQEMITLSVKGGQFMGKISKLVCEHRQFSSADGWQIEPWGNASFTVSRDGIDDVVIVPTRVVLEIHVSPEMVRSLPSLEAK